MIRTSREEDMKKTISPIPVQMDFTKPLDVLFHCHQKIASNLEALRRASEALRNREETDYQPVFATIDTVLTHFSTAGTKHTQDEEESLFPRIREHVDDGVSEVFDAVATLEVQHSLAQNIEKKLERFYVSMTGDEALDSNKTDLFCDLSESLYDLYRPHIQVENEFIFPAAGKILAASELLEIGKEMYQRRQPLIHHSKSN